MTVSDDEVESRVQSVTNYYFVDGNDEPVSFSVLPIEGSVAKGLNSTEQHLYLHGTVESGVEKIFKQVMAWKVELSHDQPEISVLCKEKHWIKLEKPRKSFQDTIRTILITLHYLHYVKKHPHTSGNSLWGHLQETFSLYNGRPSKNDLLGHLPLVNAIAKQDETLSSSKFILSFLENPRKRKEFDKDIPDGLDATETKFIVGDDEEESDGNTDTGNEDESDEEDMADTVCAICDNGGALICCDGKCLRSFHGTVAAGIDADCRSLGLSKARVEANEKFLCLNCQYKQHQCHACGKLGSSDKACDPKVFPCVSATCGYFYHPHCVAKLLHPQNEGKAEYTRKNILAGKSFTCPVHKCRICKQGENKKVFAHQFAICRRCPRAYHRKCLPSSISFTTLKDKGILKRAWDDMLPSSRVLIYCLKHDIDETSLTPTRNHILFPSVEKKKPPPSLKQFSQLKVVAMKKSVVSKVHATKVSVQTPKQIIKATSLVQEDDCSRKNETQVCRQGVDSKTEMEIHDVSKIPERVKCISREGGMSFAVKEQSTPLGEGEIDRMEAGGINAMMNEVSGLLKPKPRACKKPETAARLAPIKKKSSSSHVNANREERLAVVTVPAAIKKIGDNGVEVEKDDCEPEVLSPITKLKIVDILHWYLQVGDTIANLCCDADDYSGLITQKLEQTGKKCSVKNYHVFQPQNDNNFEKCNWASVCRTELPTGSHLIISLTLPLGVKGALVNEVIDEAFEFKPKLLIFIVPREIKRLGEEEAAYDFIWDDCAKLTNKSYLLQSISMKQMEQGNFRPSVLYLWSRSDWISKHKAIAVKQRHVTQKQTDCSVEVKVNNVEISEKLMENHNEQNTKTAETGHRAEARVSARGEAQKSFVPEQTTRGECSSMCENYENNGIQKSYYSRKKTFPKDPKVLEKGMLSKGMVMTPGEGREDFVKDTGKLLKPCLSSDSMEVESPVNSLPHETHEAPVEKPSLQNGFALGPLLPYSQNSSCCGWLEE